MLKIQTGLCPNFRTPGLRNIPVIATNAMTDTGAEGAHAWRQALRIRRKSAPKPTRTRLPQRKPSHSRVAQLFP
jgi:hypothetical protein